MLLLLLFLPQLCNGLLETALYQRTINMTTTTFASNITKTILAKSVQECTLKCTFFNSRGTVCNAIRCVHGAYSNRKNFGNLTTKILVAKRHYQEEKMVSKIAITV
jgi:formate/nitrite transporter FocA (FNT family)